MGHIKIWDSILDCQKIHRMSDRLFRVWIKLLVTVLRNGGRNGELPLRETLVFRMRMPEEEIDSCIQELRRCLMLDDCPDNPIGGMPYMVHDWDEWQLPKDRTAADRQAQWRQRQALRNAQHNGVVTGDVTGGITPVRIEGLKVEALPPKPPRRGKPVESFVIPDWIPEQDWNDWLDMRKAKGRKTTPAAMKLAKEKLAKLRDEGYTPAAVLQQSTLNSWQGLFPTKDQSANGYGPRVDPGAAKKAKRDAELHAAYAESRSDWETNGGKEIYERMIAKRKAEDDERQRRFATSQG